MVSTQWKTDSIKMEGTGGSLLSPSSIVTGTLSARVDIGRMLEVGQTSPQRAARSHVSAL